MPRRRLLTAKAAAAAFSTRVRVDGGTGWQIVSLHAREPRGRGLQAQIVPAVGANLFSLSLDGAELLHQPDTLADLAHQRAGTPVLFPTPNRVRDSAFNHRGQTFTFEPNSQRNFIHGLVRGRPWALVERSAGPRGAQATLAIDWDERQPSFDRFPIRHRLSLRFALTRRGLRIAYRVDNRDITGLPYGFGLHPFFRIPGAREDVRIQVPLARRMESPERLPTGALVKVAGSPYDLRRLTPLGGLAIDDVYYGMTPEKAAKFELGAGGVTMTLGGSREFTHLVVYTPPGEPFFCLENQTSSTDAHNLWESGQRRVAHLLTVPPGKSGGGQVDWKIARASR